jgi:hypothetical protein
MSASAGPERGRRGETPSLKEVMHVAGVFVEPVSERVALVTTSSAICRHAPEPRQSTYLLRHGPNPSPVIGQEGTHRPVPGQVSSKSVFGRLQGPSAGVLTVGEDGRTVYCPEANMQKIQTFKFDRVYG